MRRTKREKKKRHVLAGALTGLIGLACALALGALFYGTMVYQMAGESNTAGTTQTAHGLLTLSVGTLADANTQEVRVGGTLCTVYTRTYALEDGCTAVAITASPEAYIERMSEEAYVPQLVTGYSIGEMEAVYATKEGSTLLAARENGVIYMIETDASEEMVYALGVTAETIDADL